MLAIAGAAAGAAGFLAWAARGRSSSVLAPSRYRGDRSKRTLALTFDDGPSPGTLKLLDALAYYDVRATFFMVGANVRRYPQIALAVREAGHEIGNHTEHHAPLWLRSPEFIRAEVSAAQDSILDGTGVRPSLFRAPYGVRWFGLREAQRELRLLGVMWTVMGRDWVLDGHRTAERILNGASNGGIICLHDGRELAPEPDVQSTLEAVRRAVPALRDRGYRFETAGELLCLTQSSA